MASEKRKTGPKFRRVVPEPAEREPEEIAAEIDKQAAARFGPFNADALHRKAMTMLSDAHKLLAEPAAGDPLGAEAAAIASDVWDRPSIETREELALAIRAALERLVRECAERVRLHIGEDSTWGDGAILSRYGLTRRER